MYTHDYILSNKSRSDITEYLSINYGMSVDTSKLTSSKENMKLYKYCGLTKWSVNNIVYGTIMASSPLLFNDIYDSTMHTNTVEQAMVEFEQMKKLSEQLGYKDLIDDGMKETLQTHHKKKDINMMDYLTRDFRVFCLSETCESNTMWAHYGNEHRGICIEYDYSDFSTNLKQSMFPVLYTDIPVDVTPLMNDNLNQAIITATISKLKDWKYEVEWRFIIYSTTWKEQRILVNIPRPSAVILGYRFIDYYKELLELDHPDVEQYKKLFSALKEFNIPIKIVGRQLRSYSLNFIELTVDNLIDPSFLERWRN